MKRIEAVNIAKEKLAFLGEDAKAEAEWLVALSLNIKRSEVYLQEEIGEEELKLFNFALSQREKNVPLAYIFHETNFYGYDFEVNPQVLIPRSETEELVALVLESIKGKESVLDIGTGSGAIAVAIAKESNAKVTAVDISKEALKVARQNALKNNAKVNFIYSDLFEKLEGRAFDIIVSNPPYITEVDYNNLDAGVKDFEPKLALYGGEDGLDFYRKIITEAPKFLNSKGKIFFEIGYDQGESVSKLLEKDFENIKVKKDLQGINRMVYANKKV